MDETVFLKEKMKIFTKICAAFSLVGLLCATFPYVQPIGDIMHVHNLHTTTTLTIYNRMHVLWRLLCVG